MNNFVYSNPWPINVIIIAGGQGTRLKSLTENKHKSLIEIEDIPVIIHLINHLISFGFRSIYVSVGHFSNQIVDFLQDGDKLGISIKYIYENSPMGSIGSLILKEDWEYEHFLVLNGDLFTNFNVEKFISTYFEKQSDMAVLTTHNTIEIPWGVLDINSDGEIINFVEKPRYSIQINTGIYIFNQRILKLIPPSKPMEGWELIQSAINLRYTMIHVPMSEGYWIDIGTIDTLLKAREMALLNKMS